jgi:hypothetical protein
MSNSALNPSAFGLLIVCYLALGTALYWGYRRGHTPEEVGTYMVFGSFFLLLLGVALVGIVRLLSRTLGV